MVETKKTIDLFKNHQEVRKDFPILDSVINENKLTYLDNAATTHKPLAVIEAMAEFQKKRTALLEEVSMIYLSNQLKNLIKQELKCVT
jgi:selenocysteine lyase/cysteine desulfurase